LTAKLAPHLIGPIAIAAYSYMALIPIIQPPIMKLLTTRRERLIHMPDPRPVSRKELLIFPVIGLFLCCFLAPASIPLLGTFFFGNLMKVSGVVDRLAQTARTAIIDTATIFWDSPWAPVHRQMYFSPPSRSASLHLAPWHSASPRIRCAFWKNS
jgi:Na+-transporting methylmalonyl-CoA/oxaloacetate decarboxylase beta subunit